MYLFKKLKWSSHPLNFKNIQFCYLTLYLSIETASSLMLLSGFALILKVVEFKKKFKAMKVLENCSWCRKVLEFQC